MPSWPGSRRVNRETCRASRRWNPSPPGERGRGEGFAPPNTNRSGKLRASSLLDTRIIYCGDCLEQLAKLPPGSIDLVYIDPPFNSNRNYDPRTMFLGETKEKRATSGGEDRHASTQAYIDSMRPRCVEPPGARVLKKTGSFYYHCDWHASRVPCLKPIPVAIRDQKD